MEWAARNLLSLSGILLAFAAFTAEIAGAVPAGSGIDLSAISIGATAAARGAVRAAEELRRPRVDIDDVAAPVQPVQPTGYGQ